MKKIYEVKVYKVQGKSYKDYQLLNVVHYKHFENAVADIQNKTGDIFEGYVSEEFFNKESYFTLFRVGGEDSKGLSDCFEFNHEEDHLRVYVGRVDCIDDMR